MYIFGLFYIYIFIKWLFPSKKSMMLLSFDFPEIKKKRNKTKQN